MSYFKNQVKTVALLAGLSALIVVLGRMFGPDAAYLALGFAVLFNVVAYFFSDRIVLAMHHAQEVMPNDSPVLHRIVEELARKAQIPKPRVFIIPGEQPNAFATGRNPSHGVVAVTQGIMRLLTERELRGVLAHEMAHIKNRDILVSTIAAVVAAAVTHLATMVKWNAIFGGGSRDDDGEGQGSMVSGLLVAFLAPLLAMLIQFAISRTREYLADASGAEICEDPEALASALEKLQRGVALVDSPVTEPATASLFIMNPLAGVGSMLRLFSTHPRTEDRVLRLRAMARTMAPGYRGSFLP